MARPKKQQDDIEQTRRHITSAAARLFARRGFAGSTMQEIAEEAGCTPPTLYCYFKGKDDILEQLSLRLQRESAAIFAQPPPGESLPARVRDLFARQSAWASSNREAFIFLNRREGMPARADDRLLVPPYVTHLAAWLERWSSPEELYGHTPRTAAYVLWGITRAFYMRWLADDTSQPIEDLLAQAVAFFLHSLEASSS